MLSCCFELGAASHGPSPSCKDSENQAKLHDDSGPVLFVRVLHLILGPDTPLPPDLSTSKTKKHLCLKLSKDMCPIIVRTGYAPLFFTPAQPSFVFSLGGDIRFQHFNIFFLIFDILPSTIPNKKSQ